MPYVRTRLGRLFYDDHGAAKKEGDPTIVLLHGLLFDGGMWRGLIESLTPFGRVVVFDGPGHGKSEPPPRFTLEEHADALFDAFGDLGISRAILVGLSWGAMVGMRFALQHAESVAGLALLDTNADAQPLAERVKYRAFLALYRRVGIPWSLYAREIAPELFAARTIAERPEIPLTTFTRVNGADREGVTRAALAVVVHRGNILPQIGRIHVPTLVMCGREDRATPIVHHENIAHAISGSKLVILDGLGHMSALEDPAAVSAHLVPFVRDLF